MAAPPTLAQKSAQPTKLDLDEPRLVAESGLAARVASLIEPTLVHLGYRLVRVKITATAGCTIQVMAENEAGRMAIEDCERLNDILSPLLDVEDPVVEAYRLEISSPGIDRLLVRVSDFERALGNEVKMEMKAAIDGRRRFRGIVAAVENEPGRAHISLDRGDAKPGETARVTLPLSELIEARLVLTDFLIRASLREAKVVLKQRDGDRPAHAGAAPRKAIPHPKRRDRKTPVVKI